jgi:hypothetical protein
VINTCERAGFQLPAAIFLARLYLESFALSEAVLVIVLENAVLGSDYDYGYACPEPRRRAHEREPS